MKDLFSRQSKDYAKFRPRYPKELFDYVVGLAARRDLALDCATGSGQAALGLAPFFERVVAIDLSAEQLAQAQRHPKVEYRVAPAERSPLEDGSADLVTVAAALHWFDHDRFYAEVRRVLKPGGAFAAWCYGHNRKMAPAIDAILERYSEEIVGPFWDPEIRHVRAGYRTIPFPFEELAAPCFELEAQWDLGQVLGYLASWSSTQKFIQRHGSDPRDLIAAELRSAWGGPEKKRTMAWPIFLRAGRVGATLRP